MALSDSFKRLGILLEDIGRHAADAFRGTPRVLTKAEHKARIDAMPGRVSQAVTKWTIKEPAKAALWVISKPLELGMGLINGGVSLISKAFKVAPIPMLGLTAIGSALGINRLVNGSAEERTQHEMQAKVNTLQIMQAQAGAGQQSYMNSVPPEGTAALEARTKKPQNDYAPTNFAETVRPDGKAENFASATAQSATSPAVASV